MSKKTKEKEGQQPVHKPIDNVRNQLQTEQPVQPAGRIMPEGTRMAPKIQSVSAPVPATAEVQNQKVISSNAGTPVFQQPKTIVSSATVQNPKGLSSDAGTPVFQQPKAQAVVQNPAGLATDDRITHPAAKKPKTIADLIADGYKKAEKEKTDAARMQQYHALSDAFSALGRLGGSAIGGAVGGNVMDSAPVVEEYKPSRGYVDAFEKAKTANDRIKELDNMAYQLAVKDEERKYAEAKLNEQRAYEAAKLEKQRAYDKAEKEEEREYQKGVTEEQRAYDKTVTEDNRAYQQSRDDANTENQIKIINAKAAAKAAGADDDDDSVPVQYRVRKEGGNRFKSDEDEYSTFVYKIPKKYYESMKADFAATRVFPDGERVTKETVDEYIRKNPEAVNEYLEMMGVDPKTGKSKNAGGAKEIDNALDGID